MRNRTFRLLLAALAIGGLAVGASPAHAGGAAWDDAIGDANQFFGTTARPSSDELDIVRSTIDTQGADLVWVVKVKDMPDTGYPSLSDGYHFILHFSYHGTDFEFRVGDGAVGRPSFSLAKQMPPVSEGACLDCPIVPCDGCTGEIDRKTDSVVITAPVAAIADGLEEVLPELPPFGSGSELGALLVDAQRHLGILLTSADKSQPPGGTTYVI